MTFDSAKTLILAACLAVGATAASAATLQVVDPLVYVPIAGSTVVEARFRLSNTNWDAAIVQPGGPNNSTPTGQLGNVAALSAATYNFTLNYVTGTGFTFSLVNTANSSNAVSLSYASTSGFNALHFVSSSSVANSSMTASNLTFVYGAGLTGPATIPNVLVSGTGSMESWLASTSNLALFNWSVTGTLAGVKLINTSDEGVKFSLRARSVDVPTVPVPAAGWLLLAGMGAFGLMKRRRS